MESSFGRGGYVDHEDIRDGDEAVTSPLGHTGQLGCQYCVVVSVGGIGGGETRGCDMSSMSILNSSPLHPPLPDICQGDERSRMPSKRPKLYGYRLHSWDDNSKTNSPAPTPPGRIQP